MGGSRLQLLGGFLLRGADAPVEVAGGEQRLLAFLAITGSAPRGLVAGTLWPEVPEQHALASLRTTLWRVNRLLPGTVVPHSMSLSLVRTMIIDVRDQEAFATRILREPVEDDQTICDGIPLLLNGDLLPGWYDDWVVSARERLNQLRLHALERSAHTLTRHDVLDIALQAALEAVRAEPLRETANAALISVYLAEGNVWNAVQQYDAFTGLLRRELGVEPSPRLRRLLSGAGVDGAV